MATPMPKTDAPYTPDPRLNSLVWLALGHLNRNLKMGNGQLSRIAITLAGAADAPASFSGMT